MKVGIYKKNIDVLFEQYPYLKIKDSTVEKSEYEIVKSISDEKIVKVKKGKKEFYLNSRYEAWTAAQIWADQFENVTYKSKFIIMGLGNGMYLKALKERYPDNIIICIEVFEELENEVLHNVDVSDLVGDKVFLAIGENRVQLFREYLSTLITYIDKDELFYKAVPNYNKINNKEVRKIENIYYNQIEFLYVERNTVIHDEQYRRDSVLKNFFVFPQKNALGQLFDKLESYDFSDKAAIVVSAGPSLDKNIKYLKFAKNKMFLIAVDAAAKAMIKEGVKPDIIITIDPIKDETILQDEKLLNTTMICSMYSHYKIIRQHKGVLYFQTTESEFSKQIYEKYGHKKMSLPSGGSVANNAFSLAEMLGFGTIILVGQDLAYPNGQVHSKAAEYKTLDDTNLINTDDNKYFEVESNDGGKILTEGNMNVYRKWFEERICDTKANVINATEGGAKIEGAEVRTLESVIDEFASNAADIDYEKLVHIDEGAFSSEEQKDIYDEYKDVLKNLEIWKKKLKEGVRRYDKLRELNRKGKNNTSAYKKMVDENGVLTKEFEGSREAGLLKEWGNKEAYEALDAIIEKTDSLYQETENIIKAGILAYETDIKNCKSLEVEWQQLLIDNGLIK